MPARAWRPIAVPIPCDYPEPDSVTVCPGYSTSLPAAIEATWWHEWYSKGQLQLRLQAGGAQATPLLVECIEVREQALQQEQAISLRRRLESR